MIIFLNKYSNNGRGFRRWERVEGELKEKINGNGYSLVSEIGGFNNRLQQEFKRGERIIVAAGGDGTVNFLVNQIMNMNRDERDQLVLGAVGLGSSNDFHKPFCESKFFTNRVPFRLDCNNMVKHNVGQVDFEDENNQSRRKYFVLNCSIGIIAQANHLFNSKERIIRWLKSKWIMGTIWYAGLKTLFTAQNFPSKIVVENECFKKEITNLSVLINPNVSGDFCYDIDVSSQSNFFGVALAEEMGFSSRLRTIFSLANSRFCGLPKTKIWKATRVEIYPDAPTPLELDGEVYLARSIRIKLMKGVLNVCQ